MLFGQKRVHVDGKFFRLGEQKFFVKGVGYGPFAPNSDNEPFASRAQTESDFKQIVELGANVLRVYNTPPRWFLDLASKYGLRVFIDILWNKERCFLDSEKAREFARAAIRETVEACVGHPAVFAYSLVNEIPADIVRWTARKKWRISSMNWRRLPRNWIRAACALLEIFLPRSSCVPS